MSKLKIQIKTTETVEREMTFEERCMFSAAHNNRDVKFADKVLAHLVSLGFDGVLNNISDVWIGRFKQVTIRDATPAEKAAYYYKMIGELPDCDPYFDYLKYENPSIIDHVEAMLKTKEIILTVVD